MTRVPLVVVVQAIRESERETGIPFCGRATLRAAGCATEEEYIRRVLVTAGDLRLLCRDALDRRVDGLPANAAIEIDDGEEVQS